VVSDCGLSMANCSPDSCPSGNGNPMNAALTKNPSFLARQSFDHGGRRVRTVAAVLALITLATFFPAFRNGFVNLDDPDYVNNPHIQSGFTWAAVKWAFTTWHPVTWLSHALDCQFFGIGPRGHHATNVLFHTANAVLLLLLLYQMTGAVWRSALVAGLFALHPQQVEAVAWVAERKGVLSTFFGLLCLMAYARYAKQFQVPSSKFQVPRTDSTPHLSPHPQPLSHPMGEGGVGLSPSEAERAKQFQVSGAARSWELDVRSQKLEGRFLSSGWYWLTLLLLALGLMSKPMLVTWPFVMLLLDWWPLGRMQKEECRRKKIGVGSQKSGVSSTPHPTLSPIEAERADGRWKGTERSTFNIQRSTLKGLVVEKIPFFVLSGVAALMTTRFQQQAGALQTLTDHPLGARLADALAAYAHYVAKALWPAQLAVPYPREDVSAGAIGAGVIFLAGVSVLAWSGRKRQPAAFAGWAWFIVTLATVSGLLQVAAQTVADRYFYVPGVGLFIAVVWSVAAAVEHWRVPRSIMATACGGLLLAYGVAAQKQIRFWENSGTLFQHAITATPNNWLAHYNLAGYYERQGKAREALEHYLEAARIKPNYAEAQNNAGVLLAKSQRNAEAQEHFAAALAAKPDFVEVKGNMAQTHANEAKALASRGETEKAKQAAERALALSPNNSDAHNVLGTLLAMGGKTKDAILHFEAALRARPENASAHFNLGKALAAEGRREAARQHLREALRLKPGSPQVQQVLQSVETTTPSQNPN
jgi:protein O-mannosyl-transferase